MHRAGRRGRCCCTAGSATSTSRSSATRTPPAPTARSWRASRITRCAPNLAMQAIEAYSKGGFAQLVLEGKQRVRRALQLRHCVLDRARTGAVPEDCRRAQDEPHGPRRLPSRDGAEIEEVRGLRAGGALVPDATGLVPRRRRCGAGELPACRRAVRGWPVRRCSERVRAGRLCVSDRPGLGACRLCRADCLHAAGGAAARCREAGLETPLHRFGRASSRRPFPSIRTVPAC